MSELQQITRAYEECHIKLVETERAWLAAEAECIRLEARIKAALELMDDEKEPFPERHYYGKRKLHNILAELAAKKVCKK